MPKTTRPAAEPPLAALHAPTEADFAEPAPELPQPEPVPPPLPPPVPRVDDAVGESSRWRIGDWISYEASTIVHATLILVLALIATKESLHQSIELSAAASAEPLLLDAETPVMELTEVSAEVLAPTAQQLAFDPADTSDDAAPGLDGMDLGEVDATQDSGPPLGAALRMGGGNDGRGGSLHGRADLAVFAKRLTKAKAKSGDIQVSLIWHNLNDLDLHVRAPSGQRIYYLQKASRCRGLLDVDMNAGGRISFEPVENVFWPKGGAPYGEFVILVDHFNNQGGDDPTDYEVLVQVDGETHTFRGRISFGESIQEVFRFRRQRGKPLESPNSASPSDDFPL